jgi:hypothetical protein
MAAGLALAEFCDKMAGAVRLFCHWLRLGWLAGGRKCVWPINWRPTGKDVMLK